MTTNPEFARMNDVQRGALLFQIKCQRCHPNKEGTHQRGPNLWGVVGRRAGSEGYERYSEQLKKSNLVWTRKNLEIYMHDPQKMVPGTSMFYGASLPADVQSSCIVTYLESISPGYEQRIRNIGARSASSDKKKVEDLAHPEVPLFGNQ